MLVTYNTYYYIYNTTIYCLINLSLSSTHRQPPHRVNINHAAEYLLAVGGHKVRNVERSLLHLLQQLTQVVIVKWQSTLNTEHDSDSGHICTVAVVYCLFWKYL